VVLSPKKTPGKKLERQREKGTREIILVGGGRRGENNRQTCKKKKNQGLGRNIDQPKKKDQIEFRGFGKT